MVGSTILSRTLVGEAPSELSSQSVSLLVSREEPELLAGSVFSNKGSSFTLPSVPNLFGNGTQFVDSQVGSEMQISEIHTNLVHKKVSHDRVMLNIYMMIIGFLSFSLSNWHVTNYF